MVAWGPIIKAAVEFLPVVVEAGKEIFSKKTDKKEVDENQVAANREITTEDTIFAGQQPTPAVA